MSQNALRAAATGSSTPAKASNGAQLNQFLEKYKGQFAVALPKHLNPDRMIRLALTAFNGNRQLQQCDMNSIAASIITAAQLGLEIGVAGQGYLVPYKGKCTFVPGWQGYVDLVSRSGRATVWTGAAFEGDEFEFALGDSPFVRHRPGGEDDPKKLTHVYAVGRVNGSQWPVIEVWPISRVRKHFNKNNKVGAGHYAHNNWEMYARKVPLLQVIKYMPKSIELTNAMTAEAAYNSGNTYTVHGDTITIDGDDGGNALDTLTGNTGSGGSDAYVTARAAMESATDTDALNDAFDLSRGQDMAAEESRELAAYYELRRDALEIP
ncbi:recombinase RecT [Lysobacter sp. Hz 25]|uniref:recombinase RecT n=1 Tax=Lysobacter sp. Hz 25 TaxID=3383698 RepID=UPI0038D377F8